MNWYLRREQPQKQPRSIWSFPTHPPTAVAHTSVGQCLYHRPSNLKVKKQIQLLRLLLFLLLLFCFHKVLIVFFCVCVILHLREMTFWGKRLFLQTANRAGNWLPMKKEIIDRVKETDAKGCWLDTIKKKNVFYDDTHVGLWLVMVTQGCVKWSRTFWLNLVPSIFPVFGGPIPF